MKRSDLNRVNELYGRLAQLERGLKALEQSPTLKAVLAVVKGTEVVENGIMVSQSRMMELLRADIDTVWDELQKLGLERLLEEESKVKEK